LLLTTCGLEAWQRDPEVQAARKACRGLDEGGRYACVERRAVETLNPDICRLAGIWIDDMCLQAVYEAAADSAICEHLYLEGVRPTCRAYYAQFAPSTLRYDDPALGFAVEYPIGWEVEAPLAYVDAQAQTWSVVRFQSNLYGYGEQAFGKYAVDVAVGDSAGRTLAETVAYGLEPIVPDVRDTIESRCCLTVGGEPAMELFFGWPMASWGSRQVVTVHGGWVYRLSFYPQQTLDGNTPADAAARAAFDTFLRTFTFIPVTVSPPSPTPTVMPAPTPSPGG